MWRADDMNSCIIDMTTKLVSQTGGDLNWMMHRRWKGSSCSVKVTLKFARTICGGGNQNVVNYQGLPVVFGKILTTQKSETVHFICKYDEIHS